MIEQRWPLPVSWSWVSIDQISQVVGGGTPPSRVVENFATDGIPWVTPADLTGYDEAYISRGKRDLSALGYSASNATLVPAGSVLFSSRAPIGYCVIAANSIATSQGFKNLVLHEGIDPEFIRHYLLGARQYAESKASGTTFLELSAKRMGELAVPLAPFAEQKRIVAALNRLQGRTARARSSLTEIAALVRLYKQAVIDAAFSHLDVAVPLISLVDERGIPYGIVQTGNPEPAGVPTVRAGDIKDFTLLERGLKKVSPTIALKYSRTALRGGEVLIAIRGSIGEACVVPPSMAGGNISREVALVPVLGSVNPSFIMYYLRSKRASSYIRANVKGIAQTGINLKDLRNLPAPNVSGPEQIAIVRQIELLFEKIEAAARHTERSLALVDRLENSILEKAFRGVLLPQNSQDEPAAQLLVKIVAAAQSRAEKAAVGISIPYIKPQPMRKLAVGIIDALKSSRGDWVSVTEVAHMLGLGDGSSTEAIESFYGQLRGTMLDGAVIVERRENEDWLRLQTSEAP